MATKQKLQTFYVGAKLTLEVNLPIEAIDIYDALEKAKFMKETDFVEILGEYLDGSFEYTGIYAPFGNTFKIENK